jgi:hypothetical protein
LTNPAAGSYDVHYLETFERLARNILRRFREMEQPGQGVFIIDRASMLLPGPG